MGSALNEKLNRLPEARREQILAEADRLQAEYLIVQMLRKAKKLIGGYSQYSSGNNC